MLNRFRYSPSRFRYLRLVVLADATSDKKKEHPIRDARVWRTVNIPGKEITRQAILDSRQPVPTPEGPGSSWYISFHGARPPFDRLTFDVDSRTFARRYRLEAQTDYGGWQQVTSGELLRTKNQSKPLQITFRETATRKFRLFVTDLRNVPLFLRSVRYTAAARQVIFSSSDKLKKPLRLYYGNPKATRPGYDFGAHLPTELKPSALQQVSLGSQQPNPVYRPVPKPWTERWMAHLCSPGRYFSCTARHPGTAWPRSHPAP